MSQYQSCEDFREEHVGTVSCNENTEDGYYWLVSDKISGPGQYGFDSSGSFPPCGAAHLGNQAFSYALNGDAFYYDAATAYCASSSTEYCDDCCPRPTGSPEGPIVSCDEDNCGLYQVICTSMPSEPTVAPTRRPAGQSSDLLGQASEHVNTNQNLEFKLYVALIIFIGLLIIVFIISLRCFMPPKAKKEALSATSTPASSPRKSRRSRRHRSSEGGNETVDPNAVEPSAPEGPADDFAEEDDVGVEMFADAPEGPAV